VNQHKYSAESIGPKIESFLKLILQDAGIHLQFQIEDVSPGEDDFETPDVSVKFTGADVDLLLSNRAELLLALEHVTMEMLDLPSDDHSRLAFDSHDYRLLRIEELRMSAGAAAEKVKRTGVPFRFNPMNSRERRVLHLALRGETTLRSESAGAGPGRHVVVYPAGMASLPEPPATFDSFRRSGPPRGDRPRGDGPRGDRPRGDRPRGGGGRGPRR
jgi:spoIIIJ-associated protein